MQPSDKGQFHQIVSSTFAMNPKWKIPDARGIEMWWRCLEKYSIEEVAYGFEQHLIGEAGRFQPMPADIIEHIGGGSRQTKSDAGALAWQRFIDAIGTHGSYQTVIFDDQALHYAITLTFGDWIKAGQMTEDESPFRRKDFIAAYASFKPGLPYLPRLSGIADRDNASQGMKQSEPIYIGDKQKAQHVESQGRGVSELGKNKFEAIGVNDE